MKSSVSELLKNGDFYTVNCKNREELYHFLFSELKRKNMVYETFLNALKQREELYPTGIVNKLYNIALPHVDSEHVKTNALIVVKLEHPIQFHRMDKTDEEIDVKIVFLLLIENKANHMEALVNLTKLWTNDVLMDELLKNFSKQTFIHLLETNFI